MIKTFRLLPKPITELQQQFMPAECYSFQRNKPHPTVLPAYTAAPCSGIQPQTLYRP